MQHFTDSDLDVGWKAGLSIDPRTPDPLGSLWIHDLLGHADPRQRVVCLIEDRRVGLAVKDDVVGEQTAEDRRDEPEVEADPDPVDVPFLA